jgi:hypothetical protein
MSHHSITAVLRHGGDAWVRETLRNRAGLTCESVVLSQLDTPAAHARVFMRSTADADAAILHLNNRAVPPPAGYDAVSTLASREMDPERSRAMQAAAAALAGKGGGKVEHISLVVRLHTRFLSRGAASSAAGGIPGFGYVSREPSRDTEAAARHRGRSWQHEPPPKRPSPPRPSLPVKQPRQVAGHASGPRWLGDQRPPAHREPRAENGVSRSHSQRTSPREHLQGWEDLFTSRR